ncbi:hypothetical protein EDEG_03722 [Edhazardia aedis USNM 41457]|uniref:Mediator of RNA polymerase II transcription subunit 11 n=1 Tax=Edhazardia aedis (strain USNM 41457) TaxID=1003232 RepID=J9DGM2_EDHAE|nr:hypothetical protein EDEG_03722 [Edhazardia aedis USNM 41457]|eukprot:EJW01755.1 hypothetical protein EDEG_03722 [Edhazardia aedis USNM 41457]
MDETKELISKINNEINNILKHIHEILLFLRITETNSTNELKILVFTKQKTTLFAESVLRIYEYLLKIKYKKNKEKRYIQASSKSVPSNSDYDEKFLSILKILEESL